MAEYLKKELAELDKFRLGRTQLHSTLSVEVSELLKEAQLEAYLDKAGPKIDAPDRKTAVSLLMKRYGFLAALSLYSMTVFEKMPDLRPGNLSLETDDQDPLWLPSFYFHKMEASVPEDFPTRADWRDSALKQLFSENIHPLIQTGARLTGISKWILWENVCIYVRWMYETLLSTPPETLDLQRAEEDFQFVLSEADGSLFGDFHYNPLARFNGAISIQPETGREIRMRRTCCLFYLTSERGARCKTCPALCAKLPKGYGG
ncbi:hypothetical protein GKZ89_10875 [Bacillus mangrovi]|uniref:Aerobactin siderophore biosynthesis IucA/IucC-like C-terminal domain-containing protein n=1 Tax=Metabacillus mangrovi TaxID=1491830 RepID=A0A7X2V5C8_9BACI|nr:IucA/IucC family C-terminal-domain containing protein [Metabacillus mangrovi]MTH53908.1 hypothetical protein [Metabacillus mangrovi]